MRCRFGCYLRALERPEEFRSCTHRENEATEGLVGDELDAGLVDDESCCS